MEIDEHNAHASRNLKSFHDGYVPRQNEKLYHTYIVCFTF